MAKPPRKPRRLKPWRERLNVTVTLDPEDEKYFRVLFARYKVGTKSLALRYALREAAGADLKLEEEQG